MRGKREKEEKVLVWKGKGEEYRRGKKSLKGRIVKEEARQYEGRKEKWKILSEGKG